MEFKRYKTSNFFKSEVHKNLLLFLHPDFIEDDLNIKDVFSEGWGSKKYLVLFLLDGYNTEILNADQPILQRRVNEKRGIFWLEETQVTLNIDLKANIIIDSNNKASFNNTDYDNILINQNFAKPAVAYDEGNNQLTFTSEGTPLLLKAMHNQSQCGFKKFSISLNPDTKGALNFSAIPIENSPLIQPESTFVSGRKVLDVNYFDSKILKKSVEAGFLDINVVFFPYSMDNVNIMEEARSEIAYKTKDEALLDTNFLDEKGQNYLIKGEFKAQLSFVEYATSSGSYSNKRNRFSPVGNWKLTSKSESKYMLLGASGTEASKVVDNVVDANFDFVDTLKINKDQNGFETSGRSQTSVLRINQTEIEYYHDSEKSPLFDNKDSKSTLVDENDQTYGQREVSYSQVKMGTAKMGQGTFFPIIPTLAFKNNRELLELEKVIVKQRLQNIKANGLKANKLITPQGFIRTTEKGKATDKLVSAIDYIKEQNYKSETPGLLESRDKPKIKFKIKDVNLDFNISISKEDVFFVTTPELLKDAKFINNFEIYFSIKGFDINLMLERMKENEITHSNRIIVFKFSRYSVADLLKDTSKWSNYGAFNKGQETLSKIADVVKTKFDEYDNRFNGGKNEDYQYISQVVGKDPNWNGVFALDIPIEDADQLPPIFTGLVASQTLKPETAGANDKLKLKTKLKFEYVAFPVNKTVINKKGLIGIQSTSYFGLIDYDIIGTNGKGKDYGVVKSFFEQEEGYRFALTKLLVRFENSEIRNFKSYAFVKTPELFDDKVDFKGVKLTNAEEPDGDSAEKIKKLFRLKGNYQRTEGSGDEFVFDIEGDIRIEFGGNDLINYVRVEKASFGVANLGKKVYRFDLDATVQFNEGLERLEKVLKFDELKFKNIGLKFPYNPGKLPKISFDVSRLIVLPKIGFSGDGFFNSFPLKFKRFHVFEVIKRKGNLEIEDFDFLDIPFTGFKLKHPGSLWSFVFDFDLGTLGNLEFLKMMKGELLFGWSKEGGFKMGLKVSGPSSDGLHLDLFGALKLDIERLDICSFDNDSKKTFFLRLIDARLTIFSLKLPDPKYFVFNGIIYAKPGEKIAWFLAATKKNEKPPQPLGDLILGVGQRVGINGNDDRTVVESIGKIKGVFKVNLDPCKGNAGPVYDFYKPDRNWLIASEKILPGKWPIDFKFIFNDPDLYGIHLGLTAGDLKGLGVDIMYRKLSKSLGLYTMELQLPATYRTVDLGGGSLTIPNLGIDVFTNGDFKVDVGYPKTSDNWSRSCLVQIRPFVGWAGMYFTRLRTVSGSIFKDYPAVKNCNILQAGFAFRIGLGAYVDKGIFHAGASISVYGILEGALAFKESDTSELDKFFPDHFALRGRIGAIAEVIGYVDFRVVKASVHLLLRVEFGMLLALINGKLQPAPVYIEGRVKVSIDFTVACFKIFRKRICIVIHLSFDATIRFPYTLGKGGGRKSGFAELTQHDTREVAVKKVAANVQFGDIPVLYIPAVTKTNEGSDKLVHQFAINFFACDFIKKNDGQFAAKYPQFNVLKDNIIKPIFEALFALGEAKLNYYDGLRSVFLNGPERDERDITINTDSFAPLLLVGFFENEIDNSEEKDALKKYFGLNDDEVNAFVKLLEEDPCQLGKKEKCPFRPIPLPVGSKIKVEQKAGSSFATDKKGFSIEITGLFKDNAGNDIHPLIVERRGGYTEGQLDEIDRHFDSYKTQFIERDDKKSFVELDGDKDLKEDAIIPEYFEMIGLLVLDECYNRFLNKLEENGEKGETNAVNPKVSLKEMPIASNPELKDYVFVFEYIKGGDTTNPVRVEIKPNDILGEVIGRLNYFYNHGLRIPDVVKANKPTKAYYDMLDQVSDVKSVVEAAKFSSVDVVLSKKVPEGEIGPSVSLKDDIFNNDQGVKDFANKAKEILGGTPAKLNDNIQSVVVEKPYELVDVKLPIANSNLEIEEEGKKLRFFEVPHKIVQHFNDKDVLLKPYLIEDKLPESDKVELKYNACVNVEVSVIPHRVQVGEKKLIKSLELINVFADDLNLMHQLNTKMSGGINDVEKINVYLKTVDDGNVQLHPLIAHRKEAETLLIKTNLSPKTHPPVIINAGAEFIGDDTKEKFTASLAKEEISEFTRLLWEGVTTNNGGYLLMESDGVELFDSLIKPLVGEPGKPSNEKTNKVIKIVFSFEMKANKSFYGFCNFLKVGNTPEDIFKKLDDNTHSIYSNIIVAGKHIQEYHSTIPAHCFNFKVLRTQPSDEYSHYVPLEFDVRDSKGKPILDKGKKIILSKETTLPLMPKDAVDDDGNPQEGMWAYNHLTPVTHLAYGMPNRYDSIGNEYKLSFGFRDSYGFNVINLNKQLTYTHRYFDKLVPISSWPFINITYWFKAYKNGKLTWNLNIRACEKDVNYKEILAEGGEQILDSLHTALAQVSDKRASIELNSEYDYDKEGLKKQLVTALSKVTKSIEEYLRKGKKIKPLKTLTVEFSIASEKLYTELNPTLTVKRNTGLKDELRIAVKDGRNVWEYKTIKETSTQVDMLNDDGWEPKNSTIQILHTEVSKEGSYALGMGSQAKQGVDERKNNGNARAIYLIRKDYLDIKLDNPVLGIDSYYAIKPYSNKLWSGAYKIAEGITVKTLPKQQRFKEIDLDKGLSTILSKVDELLSSSGIKKLDNRAFIQDLIECKKAVVSSKLKDKAVSFNTQGKVAKGLQEEFKDLILESLSLFYQYDGIIHLKAKYPNPTLNKLRGCRLSVNFNNNQDSFKEYNFESSKIYFENKGEDPSWFIFFDQRSIKENIEFKIQPKITHIEFGITPFPNSKEIQKSNWIQLVEPITIGADTITVSEWPRIVREFPAKPQILSQAANQSNEDTEGYDWSTDLGKWKYELNLKDDQYLPGDQMTITVLTKNFGDTESMLLADDRSFEGFIAYWSLVLRDISKFIKAKKAEERKKEEKQIFQAFITDLREQLNLTDEELFASLVDAAAGQTKFTLEKDDTGWKVKKGKEPDFKIESEGGYLPLDNNVLSVRLSEKGFNLLDLNNERIKSITSKVKVWRNRSAGNPDFIYQTVEVQPATWATPHIRYFTPIKIEAGKGDFKKVYNLMKKMKLPYKSTAKLLVKTIDNLADNRKEELPVIPIRQMEFNAGKSPTNENFDEIFDNYKNGYPSISLTIYNGDKNNGAESDLPVFFANNVFKNLKE